MAHLHRTVVTLRIIGDDLIPEEITACLGCPPTSGQRKGEVFIGKKSGREYTRRVGMWSLESPDAEPEDINAQVSYLLNKLTQDISVWSDLRARFEIDLFCGLFMEGSNEGASISPEALQALGQRGIELALDIYGPVSEDEE